VTAYDRYALRAFDVHALDYLLKPFDIERFEKTLARVRAEAKSRELALYSTSAARPRRSSTSSS